MMYGHRIRHSTLDRRQSALAYNAMYTPSMLYGLPATSLSYKRIEAIFNANTVDQFLPKMGYVHSTHRALIFGPKSYGGFGVRHLFTEMQGAKIEAVISYIRTGLTLGLSMRININYLQLLTGLEEPVLTSKTQIP
jgi:hypothetical protein